MAGKIGLFGGSFDPVHVSHLIIANIVLNEFELEKVIFIPNYSSPFKDSGTTSDVSHRIEMLKMAIADNPGFELSDFEADKKRSVYTYETIQYFRNNLPENELYIIMGYDSFKNIGKWKNHRDITSNCKIIVVDRPGSDIVDENLPAFNKSRMCPLMNISSTIIREMVANNLDIKYLVNESVRHYISERKLYISTK